MKNYGERLKEMRVNNGLTQPQVAQYLNVDQSFISKVESNERSLNVDQLENLLALYGYDMDDLNSDDMKVRPLKFAFRASDVDNDDLKTVAAINKIASNIRLMKKISEAAHVRG